MFKPTQREPGQFRMLRGVPEGVNLHRFTRHVQRLSRRLANDPVVLKHRMKNRLRARMARKAATPS